METCPNDNCCRSQGAVSKEAVLHSKNSIMNHGDLLTSKLCIAFDNTSYVGYSNMSFMHDTAINTLCTGDWCMTQKS